MLELLVNSSGDIFFVCRAAYEMLEVIIHQKDRSLRKQLKMRGSRLSIWHKKSNGNIDRLIIEGRPLESLVILVHNA